MLICTDLYLLSLRFIPSAADLRSRFFLALLMWCDALRKFRAFRANHCNLSWKEGKGHSAGDCQLIPVPRASQRDLGPIPPPPCILQYWTTAWKISPTFQDFWWTSRTTSVETSRESGPFTYHRGCSKSSHSTIPPEPMALQVILECL